jgi:hypothetical protein
MQLSYPTFVWWYKGDQYKQASDRMKERCGNLGIPCFAEELDVEKYGKALGYVKDALSYRRFMFKCGIFWLLGTFLRLENSIFYIHANDEIVAKPEPEVFTDVDVGYSVGERLDGLRIIMSHGLYFSRSELSRDFLTLLATKCKTIRGERPTEHDLVRTTVFDFSGQLFDDKFVERGTVGSGGNFSNKRRVQPLNGNQKKYVCSKKGDTYIRWL